MYAPVARRFPWFDCYFKPWLIPLLDCMLCLLRFSLLQLLLHLMLLMKDCGPSKLNSARLFNSFAWRRHPSRRLLQRTSVRLSRRRSGFLAMLALKKPFLLSKQHSGEMTDLGCSGD